MLSRLQLLYQVYSYSKYTAIYMLTKLMKHLNIPTILKPPSPMAPRDIYHDPGGYQNPLLPLEPRPDSLGESGMRPRDPYRPWRGTLGPGHKHR